MNTSYTATAFEARRAPRIFCVGRNYAKHIAELNPGGGAKPCVIFMKPLSALAASGTLITLPAGHGEIHYEAELVVEIGRGGRDIAPSAARSHIAGVGLGLDLTLRAEQSDLKAAGEPWERAKAFDQSAPLTSLTALTEDMDLAALEFEFAVDGHARQHGDTADMIVSVAELIATLSARWPLLPGDLVYTGTPEGVGALEPGMRLTLSAPALPGGEWATE